MPGATSANSGTQLTRQEPWWVGEYVRIAEILERDARLLSDEELLKVRYATSQVRGALLLEYVRRGSAAD